MAVDPVVAGPGRPGTAWQGLVGATKEPAGQVRDPRRCPAESPGSPPVCREKDLVPMAKLGTTAWSQLQGNFQRVGAHSSAELPRRARDPMAFHHPKDAKNVGRG